MKRKAQDVNQSGDMHPASPFYDQTQANAKMGELSEVVRQWYVKEFDAQPPGLQTLVNADGSVTVTADDPTLGVGMQTTISMVQQPMQVGPPPAPAQPAPQPVNPGTVVGPPAV